MLTKQRGVRGLAGVSLIGLVLGAGCSDPAAEGAGIQGTVFNAGTGRPLGGAEVRVGNAVVVTDAGGSFAFHDLAPGDAVLTCSAPGFDPAEETITLSSGTQHREIMLSRIEHFQHDAFSLYVPGSVETVRGILLAFGGPDTRAFATGQPFGAPIAEVEAALQALGLRYRQLASEKGLAILGTSRASIPNSAETDQLVRAAVQYGAGAGARPELLAAPFLVYGISGGAPAASGFVERSPTQVAGLFLKVPLGVAALTAGDALAVPTYVVQAELDAFVDNADVASRFETNRAAGALWAIALERAVPHHSLSPGQRDITIDWIRTILELRLPAQGTGPLRPIAETSGWLGDPATGATSPWASFTGNRARASWFPSSATAAQWVAFTGLDED